MDGPQFPTSHTRDAIAGGVTRRFRDPVVSVRGSSCSIGATTCSVHDFSAAYIECASSCADVTGRDPCRKYGRVGIGRGGSGRWIARGAVFLVHFGTSLKNMFAISTSTSIFARSEQCCFPVPDVFRCTHGKVVRVEIFENLQRLSRYQRGEYGATLSASPGQGLPKSGLGTL